MSELMEIEPRTVGAELREPEVGFLETWDVDAQDRGRCLVSTGTTTRFC
ncbi:MAG: hypothetical protein J2P25_11230 [Nocardiopsaceae bacterium]|nr:hypothetical protein [Nocardiopsaceae bacterium]